MSEEELVDLTEDSCSSVEKLNKRKEELRCLLAEGCDGWLNDAIIFDYLRMHLPNCMVVDPIVWNEQGYDLDKYGVPVSRLDFGVGVVLIPMWNDDHWMLAAYDVAAGLCVYFDTMRNELSPSLERKLLHVASMLRATYPDGHSEISPDLKIRKASPKVFPVQKDEDSCGPLTCMIAHAIVNHKPLQFSQEMVMQWRKDTYEYLLHNDPPPVPRRRREKKSDK
ncbi:hypothetical protein QR680_004961 [Steinernema hermaphroditum]|uniref:Ubiquitin-like protease family profile domain-containing protein n=1 Tax=Steinernema hermaphroditum TaxID=289476 RepID=A0AA39HRT9_9BILA|nr:hypothetical protein QR680_004961 [Steinernema hermaphroditum]